MTSFGESLINNLAGVLSDALRGQSGSVLVLLLLIAFIFPMYFVIRMVSNAMSPDGRKTILEEDVPEMNSNDDQRANQVIWEAPRNPEGALQGLNN
jgi:hypothetical protein